MGKLQPQEQRFIDELYNRYYDQLLTYARAFLDEPGAEEAVQNVFMDACAKVGELMDYGNPMGWLVRALQFAISKLVRSRQQLNRHIVYLAQQAEPDFGLSQGMEDFPDKRPAEENVDLLYGDLAEQAEFQLLKQFAVEGKSIREIAAEQNLTVSACNQRLYRGRKKLRELLGKQKK